MPLQLEVGQGVRLKGPTIPGTGEVVATLPPNQPLTQETVMLYYGMTPDHPQYDVVRRPVHCARIVILRDDHSRHVIIPPEMFDKYAEKLESPRCPGCKILVPLQKWSGGRCPRCSYEHQPEAAVKITQEDVQNQHISELQDMCGSFAQVLFDKMVEAERKHGWKGAWKTVPTEKLQADMVEHIQKGDPRDVAGYCMFLWFREARTA
jgi:hypothetical protein